MLLSDKFLIAANVYFESTGEPFQGKVAVATVTLNRARIKGKSIRDVIFEPFQFSWANKDGEKTKAKFLTKKRIPRFGICWKATEEAIARVNKGMTLYGATHFFNPDKCKTPKWAKKMTYIVKIGHHRFYHDPNY